MVLLGFFLFPQRIFVVVVVAFICLLFASSIIGIAIIIMASASCSAPGCLEPGTNKCSSCKTTLYCCVACQTIDWSSHKEECQGRLRKMGEAHLDKAKGFDRERNWTQSLRYSELAEASLKKLNPRPLEVIKIIGSAMRLKYNALSFMGRKKEALESAKERYSLWAAGYMRNHGMLSAAFALIESLIHNKEYEQAALIARTAYEMITARYDNIIPVAQQQRFLADGAKYLARATHGLAANGGIAPKDKQKAGEETISLARKALEIHSQMYKVENADVALDMHTLANVLKYFNDDDDDEIFRLYEQGLAIFIRVQGDVSPNVANGKKNLGVAYHDRAIRAQAANDLDRCVADLERSITCFREGEQIYRAINYTDAADRAAWCVVAAEEKRRQITIATTTAAAAAVSTTRG